MDLKGLLPDAEVRKIALPIYDALGVEAVEGYTAKRSLGLDGAVVLFFGFVRKYKGLEYLIRAMPEVLRSIQVKLLVVGEFWDDKQPYLRLIEELGVAQAVTIVDRYIPNEELGRYFSAADVVVLPYVDATQSAIVSLAYAFDKPVITTDVGGLPEVVSDGETGFIVPPADSKALAEAMVRYFEDDCASRFAANVKVQKNTLSWEALVRLIEDFSQ